MIDEVFLLLLQRLDYKTILIQNKKKKKSQKTNSKTSEISLYVILVWQKNVEYSDKKSFTHSIRKFCCTDLMHFENEFLK